MKPKTTLNLLKDFFSNIIKKSHQFLFSFFEKKTWLNPFEIFQIVSLVFYSSLLFPKTFFKITTPKTGLSENIKGAPPEQKYYKSLQIVIL